MRLGIFRRKAGIEVTTWSAGGRYQHTVRNIDLGFQISEEVVDSIKQINERVYDSMPKGSSPLVTRMEYKLLRGYKIIIGG